MRQDPRCPHCDGKVSATATWCMHCGRDFEGPTDAESGRTVRTSADGAGVRIENVRDLKDLLAVIDGSEEGRKGLVAAVAVVAWIVLTGVTGVAGGVVLLTCVALGLYLLQVGSAADVLVRGAYGAAVLLVLLRVFGASTSGGGLPLLLDTSALAAVVGLLLAGRWLSNRLDPGATTVG